MDLPNGDMGPCKLLFVGRNNLARVVQDIAPDMVLVDRQTFESIAIAMLTVVEKVAQRQPKNTVAPPTD
jgi:hypothetical protein